MVEELSGGKVMYAFCRVIDPNTKLPKNVLVNWVCPCNLLLVVRVVTTLCPSSQVREFLHPGKVSVPGTLLMWAGS